MVEPLTMAFFGPSKYDATLALMRDLIAAQQAQNAATIALVQSMVEATKAQTDALAHNMALLTAPTSKPEVRLMTRADEAHYERERKGSNRPVAAKTVELDSLLAQLGADFAHEAHEARS